MSNARLSVREERDRPNCRTPSTVIPSTSSNSTAEPTTSSMRGRTLTRAPARLGDADQLHHAARVGGRRREDDAVDLEVADDPADAGRVQRMDVVLPLEAERRDDRRAGAARGELLADPVGTRRLADDEAALGGHRARARPAGDDAQRDHRDEARRPQAEDLVAAERAVDDHRLQDRDAEDVEAGELQQHRRLVERRVRDPQRVAVVEAGDLEDEDDRAASRRARSGAGWSPLPGSVSTSHSASVARSRRRRRAAGAGSPRGAAWSGTQCSPPSITRNRRGARRAQAVPAAARGWRRNCCATASCTWIVSLSATAAESFRTINAPLRAGASSTDGRSSESPPLD